MPFGHANRGVRLVRAGIDGEPGDPFASGVASRKEVRR